MKYFLKNWFSLHDPFTVILQSLYATIHKFVTTVINWGQSYNYLLLVIICKKHKRVFIWISPNLIKHRVSRFKRYVQKYKWNHTLWSPQVKNEEFTIPEDCTESNEAIMAEVVFSSRSVLTQLIYDQNYYSQK